LKGGGGVKRKKFAVERQTETPSARSLLLKGIRSAKRKKFAVERLKRKNSSRTLKRQTRAVESRLYQNRA